MKARKRRTAVDIAEALGLTAAQKQAAMDALQQAGIEADAPLQTGGAGRTEGLPAVPTAARVSIQATHIASAAAAGCMEAMVAAGAALAA